MIRYFTAFICILLLQTSRTHAVDSIWMKSNPLFEQIFKESNEQFTIYFNTKPGFLKPIDPNFDGWDLRIVKSPKDIFINISGTGQLYKVEKNNSDSILWVRLDKTIFYGYNFYSILFEYKNDIFSFGGIGLWNTNSHLRIFSKTKKEWDIVALNTTIPTTNTAYFLDYKTGQLFYYAKSYLDVGINKMKELDEWYKLDLAQKTNTKIGAATKEFKEMIYSGSKDFKFTSYPLPSLNGTIITDHENNFKFIKFPDLKIYDINDKNILQALKTTSNGPLEALFSSKSKIHFLLPKSNTITTIDVPIHFYDLKSGRSIVKGNLPINKQFIFYLIIMIVVILFSISIYKIFKSKNIQSITFDEQEEEIINMLKKNRENGLTIPELNEIVGLTPKPLHVQKRIRHELILGINKKNKIKNKINEELIIRKRDENDKRSFIYFINEEIPSEGV